MEELLRATLAQNPEAQEAVRNSGDNDIVEDSPTDYFLGAGADGSRHDILGQI